MDTLEANSKYRDKVVCDTKYQYWYYVLKFSYVHVCVWKAQGAGSLVYPTGVGKVLSTQLLTICSTLRTRGQMVVMHPPLALGTIYAPSIHVNCLHLVWWEPASRRDSSPHLSPKVAIISV